MTFKDLNLNASLLNALDDMGYTTPTTIQHKVFSVVMGGRDVCGIAQTGTGKTFAYLLPLMRLWKYSKDRYPQVLVLVPTRELVAQVVEAVKSLASYTTLEVVGVYGGVNIKPQIDAVQNGADIIVATPGRLIDIVYNGNLKLKNIKHLVIDEMDEMLNLGFRTQINTIFGMLPERRQNLLFSATIPEEVEATMNLNFNNPVMIEAAPTGTPLDNISQTLYHVPNFNTKVNLLKLLLTENEDMNRVLVFVGTKAFADDVYNEMALEFPDVSGVMHNNKDQNYRFNVVNKFQDGTFRFIVATDVIARGLDISDVSHVVNFDVPDVPEQYIHRIGRTGRADKKGTSITFVTEREQPRMDAIEELMNYKVPVLPLPPHLEISDVLTNDEKPVVFMKLPQIKLPEMHTGGGAFHEKKEKNRRAPTKKVSHKDKMMMKYGKPKTRGQKKK